MPSINLSDLASACGAKLEGDGVHEVSDVAQPSAAQAHQVCFVTDKKYVAQLSTTAGAVIAPPDVNVPAGLNVLRHPDPDLCFSKALGALRAAPAKPTPGVAATAIIGKDVQQGEGCSIGDFVWIGDGARIGSNVVIHPHAYVGAGVEIGDDSVIHPHVTIQHGCRIGKRCILHPGVVIGADGFGFHFVAGQFIKAPQLGNVEIGDDVEIGANSTVDRARFDVTRIGAGTKIDNLVQVAHNVQIGKHCAIAAQTGIAGSSELKDYVQLGGNAGVSDHITIGMGARVAAKSGAIRDVPPGVSVAGLPALEGKSFMRREAALKRLPEMLERLKALEAQVKKLEAQ